MFVAVIKRVKNGRTSDRDVIRVVKALQDKPELFLENLDKDRGFAAFDDAAFWLANLHFV